MLPCLFALVSARHRACRASLAVIELGEPPSSLFGGIFEDRRRPRLFPGTDMRSFGQIWAVAETPLHGINGVRDDGQHASFGSFAPLDASSRPAESCFHAQACPSKARVTFVQTVADLAAPSRLPMQVLQIEIVAGCAQ